MKLPNLSLVVIAALAVPVISLVQLAQDRYTLKAPTGIVFSEFRGYDAWQVIATSQPDDASGCGTSKDGCMKVILGNSLMIKAYNDGIPANGESVPDGAAMAKIEWSKSRNTASPYGVTVPGEQKEVAFMLKNSKRFPDTNGWGYATFQYNASSDTFKPKEGDESFGRVMCHQCHTRGAKSRDFVFTAYASR